MGKKVVALSFTVAILSIAVIGLTITLVFIIAGKPRIPSDEIHLNETTCFSCHENGIKDAPVFPNKHLEMIEEGSLSDNVSNCQECHLRKV